MGETTSQKDARVERCRGQGVRLPAHAVYVPGCQASQHPSAWHGFRLVSGSPPRPDASGTFVVHFLYTSETLLGHFWDTSGTALSLRHFRASLNSFENIATHYVSDLVQVNVPQASPAKLRNITFSYVFHCFSVRRRFGRTQMNKMRSTGKYK